MGCQSITDHTLRPILWEEIPDLPREMHANTQRTGTIRAQTELRAGIEPTTLGARRAPAKYQSPLPVEGGEEWLLH